MRVQVVYKSKTGNTEKVAKAIFAALPIQDKDIRALDGTDVEHKADVYFVGFWTDRGTASMEVLDYLSELKGKKIALFGTCGMGCERDYIREIVENVRAFMDDTSEYLGSFLCQGKMPIQVRERYVSMRKSGNEKQVDAMIHNFDEAMLHPDKEDLERAETFVKDIFAHMQ